MKTLSRILIGILAAHLIGKLAQAQGTFQNLDFEAANPASTPAGGFVPFPDAFPSWVGYLGTNETTNALYNDLYLGAAAISLLDEDRIRGPLIEGDYTAVLQPGIVSGNVPIPAAIAQIGLVPSDSLSLRFKVQSASTPLDVAFDGQSLVLQILFITPDYVLYGANISAFAGQTAELRFTALENNYPRGNILGIDSIVFSNVPIPEPSSAGLTMLGSLLLARRLLRRSTRREVNPQPTAWCKPPV